MKNGKLEKKGSKYNRIQECNYEEHTGKRRNVAEWHERLSEHSAKDGHPNIRKYVYIACRAQDDDR